jgi:hypothetical protein
LVYGCVVCNTVLHDTGSCRLLSPDEDGLIDVLIRDRANMPPSSTVAWYRIYSIYVNNKPDIPVEEAFPWTNHILSRNPTRYQPRGPSGRRDGNRFNLSKTC